MLANFLIGLREGLEAGLVVGILVAYLTKVGRRDVLPRLWIGIAIAIAAALAFGALLTWGPYGLSTQAQEAIGGILSVAAAGLVTWMIFWMARNARHLKHDLEGRLDRALAGSAAGLVTLGIVAVGRESIETALFVWAAMKSESNALLGGIGAVLGIAAAVLLAWLIHRGIARIDLRKFFLWTGALLVIVVAGIFAYGLGDLQEASLVPGYGQAAYNVSSVIPPTSWYGTLLTGLFQYRADPTWLQLVGWVVYFASVMIAFLAVSGVGRRPPHRPAPSASPDTTPLPVTAH